jgi:N-acetylneuraminic acid mutarotase
MHQELLAFWRSGNTGHLNDLWKYNPATNEWTWVKGDSIPNQKGSYGTVGTPLATNKPGARLRATSWKDASGHLWLFGGDGYTEGGHFVNSMNDLWKYNPGTNEWTWEKGNNNGTGFGTYGTQSTTAINNMPGGRSLSVGWTDPSGNTWLLGGSGYASRTQGSLNDLWYLIPHHKIGLG